MRCQNAIRVITAASFLLIFTGCREKPTVVSVAHGPSFSFSGSGKLATFTVYAPSTGRKIAYPDADVASAIWQITAAQGYFQGVPVKELRLTYGKVPDGYRQT